MKLRPFALVSALVALAALLNCGGKIVSLGAGGGPENGVATAGATNRDGGSDAWTFVPPGVPVMTMANKVDILLAVDNSLGMAGKSEMLAQSLHGFIEQVAGRTSDIHLGIVTSSLGSMGGDVCPEDAAHPDNNRHAHLARNDAAGNVVAANGVLALTQHSDLAAFEDNAAKLVRGVGQEGCGFEAQLESMYRFLVQPDPWNQVVLDDFVEADLGDGVDAQVLVDRKAFLRPDSLLVVLMLTDEDDSSADPLAVAGLGYAFETRDFPGSKVERGTTAQGTTAPRATSICDTNPGSSACTSCGFSANCDPSLATCQALRSDLSCTANPGVGSGGIGFDGYYAPTDDDLNVRFFRMKQRFGVDPQYPLDRYVAGFNSSSVPDRAAEHATTAANGQREIAEYTHRNTCTNPIFATALPSAAGDELCSLPRGPRTPAFVMFGLLTGVPTDLGDNSNPNWTAILGADPGSYNYTGIDVRMVPSSEPRTGLTGDWDTQKNDLQYACTFQRATPLDCSDGAAPGEECACGAALEAVPGPPHAPLCSTTTPTLQVLDKAYPATRELRLAQAMGGSDRAAIGSICQPPSDAYAGFLTRFGQATVAKLTP